MAHLLEEVLSSLEQIGSLDVASVPIQPLFDFVHLQPGVDSEARHITWTDILHLSHANATMP